MDNFCFNSVDFIVPNYSHDVSVARRCWDQTSLPVSRKFIGCGSQITNSERQDWKEDPDVDIKNAIIAKRRSRIWKPLSIRVIDPESEEYNPGRRLRIFRAMERLPVELRRAVIQHLDIPTIKSLRLTSKAWGALGEEYLVSPLFTALAHRPDIGRLIALSEHPKFSFRIQKLRFNHGEINEYHARHNTYFLQYDKLSFKSSHCHLQTPL